MSGERVKVAAIQMNSQADRDANLGRVRELAASAATAGARVIVLPENFPLMPLKGRDKNAVAEDEGQGPIQDCLREVATQHGLWIVAGSLPLRSPDPDRVFGASMVIDDAGECRAIYRKIHLFDVALPDSDESYRESHSMYPGDDPVCVDTPAGRLGLTICYDLRFPELFRRLLDDGATWFSVPSAFTKTTGTAHWHVLLRARAVENLAYVVAAGQGGMHPGNRETYGHSLVVDPWGRVLDECEDIEGVAIAEFDLARQARTRQEFPALHNRRLANRDEHK